MLDKIPLCLVQIRKLPSVRWKDYRNLRLEALRSDPSAFGSSFDEEKALKEDEWRRRIQNALFALSGDELLGMIVYVFDKRLRTNHIAVIYGFYVKTSHRGEGVGTRLLERAMSEIRRNKRIIKVTLAANSEQQAAISLYKKAGFVVTGTAEMELKVGGRFYGRLFMEKML